MAGAKRGLVNRTPLGNSLRNDLWKKLDILSATTEIPKSKLLDQAIELLLIKHGVKEEDIHNDKL